MKAAHHDEFIKEICDQLINNIEEKTNAVWVWGEPNSGKSKFFDRIKQVFDCAEYKQTRSKFDIKYKHGRTAPCFMLLDEAALDRFFNMHSSYVDAKIFLEGNGLVLENKMRHPKPRW